MGKLFWQVENNFGRWENYLGRAGGKIILAVQVGKLFGQVGKLFWQMEKLFGQVEKLFKQVEKLFW